MAILHTVNKSPYEKDSLAACLRLDKAGSTIMMIEDGVYGAMDGSEAAGAVRAAMSGIKVYVLGPDLAARGCATDKMIDGLESVDYAGFVELATQYDTVQAWL